MILPEEDLIQEQIEWLAKDIIDLDKDVEGLADRTNDFIEHYNNALDDINGNFAVLDRRTQALRNDVDAWDNWTMWVFGLLIWNAILTWAIIYVLF